MPTECPIARRVAVALALGLALAGCSLFCRFDDVPQPCDDAGSCLPGYACAAGLCVPATVDGGAPGQGCRSEADCPSGSCVAGLCRSVLVAWADGGSEASPTLGCMPWPPPAAYGQPLTALSGCLVSLPGDQLGPAAKVLAGDAGPTVQPFEDGFAIGAAALVAPAACQSGLGYSLMAPVGQPFVVVVSGLAQGWSRTANVALALDPVREARSARRDLGVVSASEWSRLAAELHSDGGQELAVGIARDCAGLSLSGAALEVTGSDGGATIAYLDPTGALEAGRSATGASGLFALELLPGDALVELAGSAGGDGTLLGAVPVTSAAGGTAWIDAAPLGP
ncbi:MAG: EB domain-containing protein [Deltaproteobacteria bacterium]